MNETDHLLIRILASTDALWLPNRDYSNRRGACIWEHRQAYRATGVRWASEGGSDAGRQAGGRLLSATTRAGLLVTARPRNTKTIGAKLTDAGEARARALAGLPGLADALHTMRVLESFEDHPEAVADSRLVPETIVAGVDARWHGLDTPEDRRPLVVVENLLLPALSRGWVEAQSDMQRRVYYAMTDRGAAALLSPPDLAGDVPDEDPEAVAEYLRRLEVGAAAWSRMTPDKPGEIGPIPLSASMLRKGATA